jgi:hypothetical protein
MIYAAEGNVVRKQYFAKWTLIRNRESTAAQKEPFWGSMPAPKEPI